MEARTGVTVHFVNRFYQLKAYLLETNEFPGAHTGVNIAVELQQVLDNGKLPICLLLQQIMAAILWLLLTSQVG